MNSFLSALPGAAAQGLIYGLMAIGVFLTFRILDIADLTVDGSFATGGCVAAILITSGWNAWAALVIAFLAGMLAGCMTGLLHTKCGIPAILAGILVQLGLYSINLHILQNKANLSMSVNRYPLLVSLRYVREFSLRNPIPLLLLITVVVVGVLYLFFGTEFGSALRATGANGNMARAQGINTDTCKVVGLMISNGLVSIAGALFAQFQGSGDVKHGQGAIVIGLAAVIIAEVLLGKVARSFWARLAALSVGGVVYYFVMQIALSLGLPTNDLKLITATIVAVFLAVPHFKAKLDQKAVGKKGGAKHA